MNSVVFLLLALDLKQDLHSVPGPEAADLASDVHCEIVMSKPVGGIESVKLPEAQRVMLRVPDEGNKPVYWIAGPDSDGRIAFLVNDGEKKKHVLCVRMRDGVERTIFERQGDALWDRVIGTSGTLAREGGKVAFVSHLKRDPQASPDVLLSEGQLEVWSLDKAEPIHVECTVLDGTMSWAPDGKQLACTVLRSSTPPDSTARDGENHESFGSEYHKWMRSPVVVIVDISTGSTRDLHAGEDPRFSPDGSRILLRDFGLRFLLVEISTGGAKNVVIPGSVYPGVIGFVDSGSVAYWSWPTEGLQTGLTENNSPLVGKKQTRALKICRLADGHFQTVVPIMDPRRSVSVGLVDALKEKSSK